MRSTGSGFEGLELLWRAIVDRRVQTLPIVDLLDELADASLGIGKVSIAGCVDLFGLEGFHEALSHGVVVGIGDPAHGWNDARDLEPLDVIAAGVLDASIGVMDEAARDHRPALEGHLQCIQSQACLQMVGHCPANHLAREGVEDTARYTKASDSRT